MWDIKAARRAHVRVVSGLVCTRRVIMSVAVRDARRVRIFVKTTPRSHVPKRDSRPDPARSHVSPRTRKPHPLSVSVGGETDLESGRDGGRRLARGRSRRVDGIAARSSIIACTDDRRARPNYPIPRRYRSRRNRCTRRVHVR